MEFLNKSLNDKEAAAFLGLHPQTLRTMRMEKRGPAYHKLGWRIVYRVADLEAYLAAHRIDPASHSGGDLTGEAGHVR
jgi:hypothetical protein